MLAILRKVFCVNFGINLKLEETNGISPTTLRPISPMECIYENNPTSSDPLCYLWCKIQKHEGFECFQCPEKYKNDQESQLICELWEDLEMLKHDIQTSGSITTAANFQNVSCKYSDHPTSSNLLCEVWCQIQELNGVECVSCPSELKSDPEGNTLCQLWEELVNHKNSR